MLLRPTITAALIHVERALLAFGASAHYFNSPVSGPR